MNNLDNLGGYYIPNTLDGINIVTETVSNDALLVDGTNMMLADIDMNFHVLKNLDPGIADTESVNVAQLNAKANILYVDARDTLYDASMGSYVRAQDTLYDASMVTYTNSKFLNKTTTDVADGIKVWQNIQIHSAVSAPNSEQANETTIFHSRDLDPKWSEGITASNNDFIISRWTATGTSNDVIKLRHTTNDIQINQPITMSSKKITSLANGTTANDAINFSQLSLKGDITYINSQDALRVLKSGDTMSGNLDMSSNKVTSSYTPISNFDLTNKLYVDTQDNLRALDTTVVHLAGVETVTGIKTFNFSPIVPTATNSNQATNLSNLTTALNNYALDSAVVHRTGTLTESIGGLKTFNSNLTVSGSNLFILNSSADIPALTGSHLNHYLGDMYICSRGTTVNNGIRFLTTIINGTATDRMILTCDGKLGIGTLTPSTLLEVAGTAKINGTLNMNTTNKIINLANGTVSTDAVNKSQLDLKANITYVDTQDNLRLLKAGDTMTGALSMNTTNKITNLASGTVSTDAVNKGQMDTEFSSRERTRPQTTACQLWRKVGGVDTAIWAMGVGWSIDAHADPVAASGSTGLEYTPINDGVFLRTYVALYKGDSINGFFYSCKAPDDNGSVVKIFVYDWNENLVATTEASTCANKSVVYCPFTTAWTVPSTQTYKICLVYQSGGTSYILTCQSIWLSAFNSLACAYNNSMINQTNQTPPSFYDIFDTTLGKIAMIFAYRTI